MQWVGMSSSLWDDPAVLRAGRDAELLLCRSMQYAAATESDGFIAREALPRLWPSRSGPVVAALVHEGLWLEVGRGWQLGELAMKHYTLKAAVDAEREAGRKRQRDYRKRHAVTNARSNAVTSGEVTEERTPPLRGGRTRGPARVRCIHHGVELDAKGVCRSCEADKLAGGTK